MIISFEIKGQECLIDHDDVDLVETKWAYQVSGDNKYARHSTYDKWGLSIIVLMHRVIMERVIGRKLKKGEFVDHKNGNSMDNTRINLRIATHTQNLRNAKTHKNNKLGIKGVYFDKKANRYRASISLNGKTIKLGTYATAEEASAAYCKAAIEYAGEFARFE